MKVALVRGKWHSIWESLACGYLYSFTRHLCDDYVFLDGYFDDEDTIVEECSDASIVGFTGTTSQLKFNLRIARLIKKRNPTCWIVFGGYGPSANPADLEGEEAVDCIVTGDGEETWRQVLEGRRDAFIFNAPVMRLDDLPFPDREFIKVERCIAIAEREEGRRVTGILGNRGCLRRCKFCLDGGPNRNLPQGSIYGVELRERSARNIVDEMFEVREAHSIEFFKFADPEVNTRPGRTRELCEELIARGWDTAWGGNFLVNPFDEADAELLAAAACKEVWMGLESGSPEVLKSIGKGTSVETTIRAFRAAREAGLMRRSYVLLGTPLETAETIEATERLIDQVEPDTISFSILAPYPGTEYFEPSQHADLPWDKIDEYSGSVSICSLTAAQLDRQRQRLMDKYRGNLAGILRNKVALGIISTDEIAAFENSDFRRPDATDSSEN